MGERLVSIGMPVFNGEKYLESALDSLLKQDYRSFELIISDNASTDRTAQICLQYAAKDKRVQFHRNAVNLGAVENFNRVFRLSHGDFFMWAAHDDLWHPAYITRCLEGLAEDSNIVLCASTVQFIDEAGVPMPDDKWRHLLGGAYNRLQTRSLDLRTRVRQLTKALNWYAVYGIIRADVLRRTRLFLERFGSDVILLMELLFHGETYILNEPLFCYRLLPRVHETPTAQTTTTGNEDVKPGPYTALAIDLLNTIGDSHFSPAIKDTLSSDLLRNISSSSRQWVDVIRSENPAVDQARGPRLRSVEIRNVIRSCQSAT
jgi:glycosyltransferase involved in cell wall biosynthesis